jgi:hypothetical protein
MLTTKTLAQVKTDLGLTDYELTTNKSQSLTKDATSAAKYPSVKAVKDYVDGKVTIGSADKLTTPREINGVEFDGTKDISIPLKLTGIDEGNYTNANIHVDANGVITLIENGTGGATLTPATDQKLGGVIIGGGLSVDGTGKLSSVTDLVYTADPTKGVVGSTTGTQLPATIPAGSTSNASLMLPADKNKLDKIPEPTTTADLVLTSKADGTMAWKAPTAAPGGGGGALQVYYPAGATDKVKFFARATGPGVTAVVSGSTITVTIPVDVHLDYLKISVSDLSGLSNATELDLEVIDLGKKWNKSIDDFILPIVNTVTIMSATQEIIHSPATAQLPVQVNGHEDGKIKLKISTNAIKIGVSFYVTLRF